MKRIPLAFLTFFVLAACGNNVMGVDVKPQHEPEYNLTQSSRLLACVGGLINYSQGPGVDFFISDIPDHTTPVIEQGFLTKNAIMMVTTAVDRINSPKVAVIGKDGGNKKRRQVQILGAFTELNRTTQSNALSGEVLIPGGFEIDLGHDRNFNHIALDLALAEDNRIVPGTSTSVSIQIFGNSGDMQITFDDGGEFAASGGYGYSGQEGFHSAQRLLIETSVALMVSRYYNVDISACLAHVKKRQDIRPPHSYDAPVFLPSFSTPVPMPVPYPPPSYTVMPQGYNGMGIPNVPASPGPVPGMLPAGPMPGTVPGPVSYNNGLMAPPAASGYVVLNDGRVVTSDLPLGTPSPYGADTSAVPAYSITGQDIMTGAAPWQPPGVLGYETYN